MYKLAFVAVALLVSVSQQTRADCGGIPFDSTGNPTIPKPMKAVVAEYLRDQFQWFVFDVVDVGKEIKTKEAIQYRFATRWAVLSAPHHPLRGGRHQHSSVGIVA